MSIWVRIPTMNYHFSSASYMSVCTSACTVCLCVNQGDVNHNRTATYQWSFRGGTRGNAVPIVEIPLERMGTAFPLLSYGENAWERCCIVIKLPNTVPLGHKHIYTS